MRITREVEAALQEGARTGRERGKETCFVLFAKHGVIVRAIRAGQPLEHAAMTRPDFDASDTLVREMREEGFDHVGQAHVHLGHPGASGGDFRTLRQVAADGWPGYHCVVANIAGNGLVTLTGHSVDAEGNPYDHEIEIVADRIAYEPLIPAQAHNIALAHFGLGTGGCTVAHQEALWQLRALLYIDHDAFVERNAQRHYVSPRAAKRGIKKTRWADEFVKPRTRAAVRTIAREVTPQRKAWLQDVAQGHDLVVDCMGHPMARQLISEACKTARTPLITAGVFDEAKGGFVFVQGAREEDACVSGCLFKLTKHSRSDDRETLDHLARDYGMTPDQLDAQQGLFTDVTMIAALQAKVILEFIKGVDQPANLYLIDNQTLTLRKAFVKQSARCTNCHPERERSIA